MKLHSSRIAAQSSPQQAGCRLGVDWEAEQKEAQQAGHRLGVDWEAEQKEAQQAGHTLPRPSLSLSLLYL